MINNNKGGISDFVELLVFTLSIFVFFFLFLAITLGARAERAAFTADSLEEKISNHDLFVVYLETPANPGKTNLDIVIEAASTGQPARVEDGLRAYLSKLSSVPRGANWQGWCIITNHPEKGEQVVSSGTITTSTGCLDFLSYFAVPLNEQQTLAIYLSPKSVWLST